MNVSRQRVADIASEARWLIGSVVAMFLTGIPLMASLAYSKYYFNVAFRLKMYFLLAALLCTFFVRQRVALSSDERANSGMAKVVAVVSVLLSSGVGIMGRGIGFY